MHHTCMYQDQNHGKMHHRYVHRNHIRLLESPCPSVQNKICRIIHTCIRIKGHRCMHHTFMYQDQGSQMYASSIHASGSRIIDVCIIHTFIKIKDHRCMHHTYLHRIKDIRCMHHTYMHQDQGSQMFASYIHASRSRITDVCIIHTCIRIKDHRCLFTCIMDTSAWVTRPERPSSLWKNTFLSKACLG